MTIQQQPIVFTNICDYSKGSLYISPANQLAYDAIDAWPQWVDPVLLIHGPSLSGKTHLAHIWQQSSQAQFYTLGQAVTSPGPLILDGLKPEGLTLELFHFLNRLREEKTHCLILAQDHPQNWPQPFPDLTSRLKALMAIGIQEPEADHQAAILQKIMIDFQMRLSPQKAHRLLLHAQRSYEGLQKIIQELATYPS